MTLQEGILRLSTLVNPAKSDQWSLVRQDASRLLRLWGVKESDPAATEMATQLLGMIDSFVADHPEDVVLLIEEKEKPAPPVAPVLPPVPPPVLPSFLVFDEEEAPPENVKVVVIHETPASAVSAEEIEEADDDDADADADADADDDEPTGCLAVSTSLDVEDEEEDEEEDNDGVEVQKIFFKGRSYWLGSDNKIYACADDDEIGEEIGDYDPAEKKPRFY